jgi:hypothetical protein
MQNLLICALAKAVAFEIISLQSYALHKMMVPLPESLENFPEYITVTLSCSNGCQECQQVFIPSEHFLILERAKNYKGLS